MKKVLFLSFVLIVAMMASCSKVDKIANVMNESDEEEVELRDDEVDEMSSVINSVASSLDSIQTQENMIFEQREGTTTREKLLIQLGAFKDLLARKQAQITELMSKNEALANSKNKTIQNLQKMIEYLNQQIKEKNEQIARMEELLQQKDMELNELRIEANNLRFEREELREENDKQRVELNTRYYCMGTKKELKAKGVLKGGFLKKTKVDNDNIDTRNFATVDARTFKTLTIPGKDPKLMSNNPQGSYTLTDNGNGTTTLTITNPAQFWKVSDFLIIEY